MERREFIKATALASSGLFALKNMSSSAWAASSTANGMPYSSLGRTGVQVSKLGIGTAPLGRDNTDIPKVNDIIAKAIDEGINYMDTAPNYANGEAERRLGHALKGKRDKVFIVTKTEADTYEGTMELLENSLKHIQTDHVDLVHLHNLGHLERWKGLDFAFSKKGAMGALRKARQQGKVRFIGASGHLHPSRFHYAIDSGEIDVMMNAVNFVNQHTYDFEHKVWARAQEKNIGLVAMKVLGGNQDNEFRLPKEDYENAIRYALSLQGLCTAVIGINKMAHLDQLLETFRRVDALDEEEFLAVAQRGLDLLKADESLRTAHGLPVT
ncbi:MAG: aldo/keto reductase [Verrucomicrobia bacterium]|nr:aldo/keto reductase [Verrucomicrobiota bacterium]